MYDICGGLYWLKVAQSHLLPPEKHHLGLRTRGHSYTFPICPNKLCKSSFIPRCLFCFLWLLTVFSITVFAVSFCCNSCVCHSNNKESKESSQSSQQLIVAIVWYPRYRKENSLTFKCCYSTSTILKKRSDVFARKYRLCSNAFCTVVINVA